MGTGKSYLKPVAVQRELIGNGERLFSVFYRAQEPVGLPGGIPGIREGLIKGLGLLNEDMVPLH